MTKAMAPTFQPLTFTPIEFSLTDGTQIPAPLDSPPRTPIKSALPTLEEERDENTAPNGSTSQTPESKLNAPLSPLSATSTGSKSNKRSGVRKFLSLRSLRGESKAQRDRDSIIASPNSAKFSYDITSSRPGSPLTTNTALSSDQTTIRRKKSVGWFGSASGRRKSSIMIGRLDEQIANGVAQDDKKPKGPPPPAIPELKILGDELEMGGDNLFKDIK